MENQINVGDQNTQQIGQNPVIQPVQIPERPKANYLVIGLVILVCFVLFGFGGYYLGHQSSDVKQNINLNQPQSSPTTTIAVNPMGNWKTYKNNSYEFQYPNNLKLDENNLIPTLSHSIAFKNSGGCNMSGNAPILNSLTDFKVTFEVKPANFYPYQTNEGQVTFGNLTGKYYTNGVEGCGEIEYYFPAGGKTLVVKKTLIQALELSSQAEEILRIPGVISPGESRALFSQILSTFKFTSPTSTIPKSISDLFSAINTKFNVNLTPVEEIEFYSPSGMLAKKSWKINLMNTAVVNSGKGFITFLRTQLSPNDAESGGIGGGGTDGYQNDSIKCFHTYMSEMPSGKQTTNFLSCAEK